MEVIDVKLNNRKTKKIGDEKKKIEKVKKLIKLFLKKYSSKNLVVQKIILKMNKLNS